MSYSVEEVFVPSGFPIHTYISRPIIEKDIQIAKLHRSKHILIYGGSKMGKSNLWRKSFSDQEVIKIPINSTKTLDDIYSELLYELQAFYTSERGKSTTITSSLLGELQSKVATLFNARAQASIQSSRTESEKEVPVATPLIGCNLVTRFLKPSGKRVVLEDFHYANEDVKKRLSEDLKAFSDDGQQFIMLSVQYKNTEMTLYNPDLTGRIIGIQVGTFSESDLGQIIQKGTELLNIEFSKEVTKQIIEESMQSAALTQEICLRMCLELDIISTCTKKQIIDDVNLVARACESIAKNYEVAYSNIVAEVAAGGRSDGTTEKYKWFLKMVRDTDIPEYGLRNTEVLQRLRAMGHDSIEQGSVTSGIKYLPTLLKKRKLPPVFDSDETGRFYLLDKYMKFVFKWRPQLIDRLFVS